MSTSKAELVRGLSTAKIVQHLGELDRRALLKAVSVSALEGVEKKTRSRSRSRSKSPTRRLSSSKKTGGGAAKKKKKTTPAKKTAAKKKKPTTKKKSSGKGTGKSSRKGSNKGSNKGSGKGTGNGSRTVKWDHALMSTKGLTKYEGFYATSAAKATELNRFPKAHRLAWFGKTAFLTRLRRAQKFAEHQDAKGDEHTCLLEDSTRSIGSGYYSLFDPETGITYQWLAGLTHYISKHNVQPSHEFLEYISDKFWSET
jgi:hypothetical protein